MRIISGTAKGRSIDAPAGRNTRPTGSFVREAVFGMLGERVQGAQVLDLFCGSGAMAFEALSRGAAGAVLIDIDAKACAVARANAAKLGFENCKIYRNDYLKALDILGRKGGAFDIIFLDPPYAELQYYTRALKALKGRGLLQTGGAAVCEHDKKQSISADGYTLYKHAGYGNKAISILTEEAH